MAMTTLALGEEDSFMVASSDPTTLALGEEDGGGPTTMATGEEDGGHFTTMALGEEDKAATLSVESSNPFGAF